MSTIVSFPRHLLNLWKEHRKAKADQLERKAIAKAFNDRYTYRHHWKKSTEAPPGTGIYGFTPLGGYAWMCPDCNHVHLAESCSVFSGLQYPGCCSTPAGHRLHEEIKKTPPWSRA